MHAPAATRDAPPSPLLETQWQALCAHAREHSADLSEEVHTLGVQAYLSPEVWQRELEVLFRRQPLLVAHSSEIGPGQAMAHDAYGIPLLITRDQQGQLHAMFNVCRHRGMRLVDASGVVDVPRQMICAYHGWSYQLDGVLRARVHEETFRGTHCDNFRLRALPCAERHGLIWVLPQVDGQLDIDAYLGDLDRELAWLDTGSQKLFRTFEAEYDCNWKLIIDAFSEALHVRMLHARTVGPFFHDGVASTLRHGDHAQHSHALVARRSLDPTQPLPGDHWSLRQVVTPTQVIFPNTVAIYHPDYTSLISLYPISATRTRWTHRMLIAPDRSGEDWMPHWEKSMQLVERGVFQSEDIHACVRTQQGLDSGAIDHFTIGRMEFGIWQFHQAIARALAADDASAPSTHH